MYSVMLLAALSTTAETPDFGRRGCDGCYATCSGYVVSGCNGCNGCSGGGLFSHKSCGGGLFSRRGCSGCSGGGLFSGGLFGRKHKGCNGCSSACNGCSSACSGWACSGSACHGGYIVCSGSACSGSACHGGVIYGSCSGSACHGGVIIGTPVHPKKEKLKDMPKENKDGVSLPTPATIVVELPADAKVSINGQATTSTSSVRTFVTPELAPAKKFTYSLTAEIVRDGQTLSTTETVAVSAGKETRLILNADKFTANTSAQK